ncbi:MAG: MlaA family lipoprotein [Gammaproteobacteria bacterium]
MNKIILTSLFLCMLSGCATTQTTDGAADPLQPANRVGYSINDTLDLALLKPIAETYEKAIPQLLRTGITNFFDNLNYLNVILNSFLQGKIDQGLSDVSRFVFNSTIGLGGLVDVSTVMGLPAHDEDLGQTFAVWGFGQGAYFYLPVEGPHTASTLPDIVVSALLNPLTYVTSAILFPLAALNIINERANLLEATNIRDEAAVDPYIFTREAYLQRRKYLIYDGNPPPEGYDDIFQNGNTFNEESSIGEEQDSAVLRIE